MNAEVQQTPSISAQEGFSPLVPLSLLVPGVPHPLLAPEMSPAASRLRQGFERAAKKVAEVFEANQADMLLILSTQWPSILGHQMQAAERLQWEHVDPEFHELGSHRYDFGFDGAFADAYVACAQKRGLHARSIRYQGFPVDTGTVVARELLDPKGRWPVAAVSCNIYADRAEMVVLGKAAADALHQTGRRAVAVMISGLSHRMIPRRVDPSSDRIATERDHEWNQKLLEILSQGRLEDVAQLARNFAKEARADQKFKAIWWLSGLNGEHNNFTGDVLAYEPVQGTGAAVVTLTPNEHQAALVEFDEDQVEVFRGERKVLN